MEGAGIDRDWLTARVREAAAGGSVDDDSVSRLRGLLGGWAVGFAARRTDVVSSEVAWPRRGLRPDEARSFLRALERGFADVDDAGYVTLPKLRPKTPVGRYALLSRSGDGVAVNLEYLIQVGATAELVLDHGWSPGSIDFERGEFDALGLEVDRVVLAMEAKARVTGPDSLEKLVEAWLVALEDPTTDRATNAGRKLAELVRLTDHGPVLVWLVADGARWPLWARNSPSAGITLYPARSADRTAVLDGLMEVRPMLETQAYDPALHRPGTAAHDGGCSWHGPVS